jgi:acyl-CoA reductase-like NAD-dependent aldehyde dehydrogenase
LWRSRSARRALFWILYETYHFWQRQRSDMTIAREEIFGPVLTIIKYKDEEDAVRIANDTIYGLAGAVWSGDEERANRVARRLQNGTGRHQWRVL